MITFLEAVCMQEIQEITFMNFKKILSQKKKRKRKLAKTKFCDTRNYDKLVSFEIHFKTKLLHFKSKSCCSKFRFY